MFEKELKWFIEFITQYPDIFSYDYIGNWARRIAFSKEKGHLIWLFEDDDRLVDNIFIPGRSKAIDQFYRSHGIRIMHSEREEAMHVDAYDAFLNNKPLPKYYHIIDQSVAEKAFYEGIKKYGEDFAYDQDAEMLDAAIQLALFNEIIYG